MANDETDETTEEQRAPLAAIARRRRAAALDDTTGEAEARARPRPQPGRSAEDEGPEPVVVRPGSLSRTLGHIAITVLAIAVLYTAWQHSRRDNDDDNRDESQVEAEKERRVPEAEPEVTTTLAQPGDAVNPEWPEGGRPSEPTRAFTGPPPMRIDPNSTYVATVETSRGDFQITLDPTLAPQAVNNFVFLARWRFYEGAGFHRVEPDFLMDAGDPIGGRDPSDPDGGPKPGFGSPGYTIDAEPPPAGERPYPVMSVTTVLTAEGDAHGSQFSIVTGEAAETADELAPNLRPAVIGHVTSGQEVIQAINDTGDELTGLPMQPTVIERITIEER